MNILWMIASIILVIFTFFYNMLGFMNLAPVYITAPLFFISIFIAFMLFNNRNTFRGF